MNSTPIRLYADGPELIESGRDVWYAKGPLSLFGEAEIAFLKERAAASERRRSRICVHPAPEAPVHEMLIAHHRTCYVRPHRHPHKAESLLVVEGEATALFYEESGDVASTLALGPPPNGVFAYRVEANRYHSLLIASEWLIFLEVSQGPFTPAASQFPPWAPDGSDPASVQIFERRVAEEAAAASRH